MVEWFRWFRATNAQATSGDRVPAGGPVAEVGHVAGVHQAAGLPHDAHFDQEKAAPSPQFFALNELDKKLRKYLVKRNGFFVELGANDGADQSNTLHFERDMDWRGVLIEPIPHQFLKCLENRGERNDVFCAACVPEGYPKEFVTMIYSNLMTVAAELDLDVGNARSHAERGLQFLPRHERNLVFGALARTLTSILDEANAPRNIDLLSLDVEGGELDVLKGLDLNKYIFEYMLIEGRDSNRLTDYLGGRGYRLIDQLSEQDYLFRLNAA